jgi:protein-disulfide isomerase
MAKNRPNPADADRRRQARVAQQQAAAAAARRRTLTQIGIIGGVAVVVIAIIATAVVLGTRDRGGPTATPAVSTTVTVEGAKIPFTVSGSAFRLGPTDAKANVDLWVDYSCPHCQEFEAANNAVLNGLLAKGDVAINYHNIQIVTGYGTEAGSASACVAVNDPDRWVAFNSALYANHNESTDGWTASDFRTFAAGQGAGSATQDCISSERYRDWIAANTADATKQGVQGTPTMFLNGQQQADTPTGQALVDKVNALVAS